MTSIRRRVLTSNPRTIGIAACLLLSVLAAWQPPASVQGAAIPPEPAAAHAPILIEGDQDFRPANGVVGGRGTASDPYVIEGWEVNASTAHGIDMRNTTAYVVLRNLTIDGGIPFYYGVRLTNVSHAWLEGLNLTRNEAGAWFIQVRDSAFIGSNITDAFFGVYAYMSANLTFEGVEVRGVTEPGLAVGSSSVLTVRWVNVTTRSVGILLENVDAATVANVTVGGGGHGIGLYNTTWTTVEGSRVTNSTTGMLAIDVQNVTLQGTEIVRNGWDSPEDPMAAGIYARYSAGLSIVRNSISENAHGIVLDGSSAIDVWGNAFRRNGLQASDTSAGANRWDKGYPTGGNYWSNSSAWDECRGPAQDDCSAGDGLGDMPYSPGSGIIDHFPLVPVSPPNVPPTAAFSYGPSGPFVEDGIAFNASASVDPDGWPLRFDWDFGDGTGLSATDLIVTHIYPGRGPYRVVLTVTDVRKASDSAAADVRVSQPPQPSFTYLPTQPLVGRPVTFDASASYDPDGSIVRYTWSFGDSTSGSGVVIVHSFASEGSYIVALTVEDDSGLAWSAQETVHVGLSPIPPIVLVNYSHSSGFRLPIPANWTRQEDQVIEGETIELVLLGPTYGAVQTNILVDTGMDPAVRETSDYLLGLADATVQATQDETGYAIDVTEGPTVRTIAGHAAVAFKMQYGTTSLYQKVAIIVSEAHQRYWILVLTTDAFVYPVMDDAFERMLAGFEITLGGPFGSSGLLVALLAGGILAGAAVGLAVLLVHRSRIRKPGATPPKLLCPTCGSETAPGMRFCGRCGASLPPPPT